MNDRPGTVCATCGDPMCVYQILPPMPARYYVDDVEVTEAEFVTAERSAGFWNTLGHDEKPATGGFSTTRHGGTSGRVEYV